ncbi:MAG: hypothetical protein JO237_06610, partial [Pseudolabrys sp.]|nr:hypothetical protein [Pseudolabrys sp.]
PAEQPTLARSGTGAVTDAEREGIASPIEELLAAINNENPRDQRHDARTQPPPQPAPVPARVVQQTPLEPPARSRLVEQSAMQTQPLQQVGPAAYAARAQAIRPTQAAKHPPKRSALVRARGIKVEDTATIRR